MNDLQALKNGLAPKKQDKTELAEAGLLGGSFLGQMRIVSGSSDLAKKQKMPVGNWAYAKSSTVQDLGEKVLAFVVAFIPKATDSSGGTFVVDFDNNSETYQNIKARSDAERTNQNLHYGVDFLVWLPARKEFVSLFCGSPSLRVAAETLLDFVQEPVAFGVELIEKPDFSYHVPVINGTDSEMPLPSLEECEKEINTFMSRKAQGPEIVEEETASAETGGRVE